MILMKNNMKWLCKIIQDLISLSMDIIKNIMEKF